MDNKRIQQFIDLETNDIEYFIFGVKENGEILGVKGHDLAQVKEDFDFQCAKFHNDKNNEIIT